MQPSSECYMQFTYTCTGDYPIHKIQQSRTNTVLSDDYDYSSEMQAQQLLPRVVKSSLPVMLLLNWYQYTMQQVTKDAYCLFSSSFQNIVLQLQQRI